MEEVRSEGNNCSDWPPPEKARERICYVQQLHHVFVCMHPSAPLHSPSECYTPQQPSGLLPAPQPTMANNRGTLSGFLLIVCSSDGPL